MRIWMSHVNFYFVKIQRKSINLILQFESKKLSYTDELKIDTPDFVAQGLLVASTNWGILRGLETFSQILHATQDYSAVLSELNF